MTDPTREATHTDAVEALAKKLEAYAKDQGGWHNIDETCEQAASLTRTLSAERKRGVEIIRDYAEVCEFEKARADAAEARVKALTEAGAELADLMDDVVRGEYEPDSFTTQPMRFALAAPQEPQP